MLIGGGGQSPLGDAERCCWWPGGAQRCFRKQKGVAAHLLVNEVGGSLHCNCSPSILTFEPWFASFQWKDKEFNEAR